MQFFGHTPSRGWPSAGNFFPFEGYEKFVERIKNEVEKLNAKQSSKVLSKYIVKAPMMKSWNYAVAEATEAMNLDNISRIRLLTFDYYIKDEAKTPKPTKRPLEVASTSKASHNESPKPSKARKRNSTGKKAATSPEDVYNFNDDSDSGEVMGKLTLKNRKAKGDFQVYLRKHFEDECKANSDMTKMQVTAILKQKWSKMTDYERSYFVERIALFENEANMLVSKRASLGNDYDSDSDNNYSSNDEESLDRQSNENNGEGIGESNDKEAAIRKAKARKSEKLFDMIIDGGGSSKDEETTMPTKTKRLSESRLRTPKKKPDSKTEPSPAKTKSASKNGNAAGSVLPMKKSNKVLFVLGDNDFEQSDASYINSFQKDVLLHDFCFVCLNDGIDTPNIIKCSGDCNRYFHKKCVELDSSMTTFLCEECSDGKNYF